MRAKRAHGRILSVETLTRGSALAEDAAAGATSITVVDAGDFEETDDDGPTPTAANPLGWLTIGAQVVAYLSCDDDTGVIDLAEPLAAAGEEGDTVAVWSELYEEAIEYQQALVELDGRYDNPELVEAEVHEGVAELPEGDRGKPGESCTLKRLSADEWEIVAVGGRSARSKGPRWEHDDGRSITQAEVDAGQAILVLSHRPANEALTCVLANVPRRPTHWTIDYDAQTLTITLPSWAKAGYVLWVHYAYYKGIATATTLPNPDVVLEVGVVGPYTVRSAGVDGAPVGDSSSRTLCDNDTGTGFTVDSYLPEPEVFLNGIQGQLEHPTPVDLTGAAYYLRWLGDPGGVSSIRLDTGGGGTTSSWTGEPPVETSIGFLFPLDNGAGITNAMNGYTVHAYLDISDPDRNAHHNYYVSECWAIAIIPGTEV